MPESLTRKKRRHHCNGGRLQIGMVAGFISERWPASNRNSGQLHVGTPGRIKSESAVLVAQVCGQAMAEPVAVIAAARAP